MTISSKISKRILTTFKKLKRNVFLRINVFLKEIKVFLNSISLIKLLNYYIIKLVNSKTRLNQGLWGGFGVYRDIKSVYRDIKSVYRDIKSVYRDIKQRYTLNNYSQYTQSEIKTRYLGVMLLSFYVPVNTRGANYVTI